MLGRLEMDVDECISAYTKLMKTIFEQKSRQVPLGFSGRIQSTFDSSKLRNAINEVITGQGFSPEDLFSDGQRRGCRVQVHTLFYRLSLS